MLIIKNLNRMNPNTFLEEQISILNDFLEFLDRKKILTWGQEQTLLFW